MRWKICFIDYVHLALPLVYTYWFRWPYVYSLGGTMHAERINRFTTCTEFIWLLRVPPSYMLPAMWVWILEPSTTAPDFIPHPSSVWLHESDVFIAFLSFARCGDVSAMFVYTCVSIHNLDQEPRHLAFSRLLAAVSPYVYALLVDIVWRLPRSAASAHTGKKQRKCLRGVWCKYSVYICT